MRLQAWLQRCNHYVQDFIQVCEIPVEEVKTMHLVINAKARPRDVHSGVYNQPTGLKEAQVLMDDSLTEAKEHSIVIRPRRGEGPLQYVSDIHHSFNPLHYPLLFPEGKDSWYAGMPPSIQSRTPSKQLSVHDFYAYHLNEHDDERDSPFHGGRLFQEYCCCVGSSGAAETIVP
jgi:hypothetical protein